MESLVSGGEVEEEGEMQREDEGSKIYPWDLIGILSPILHSSNMTDKAM